MLHSENATPLWSEPVVQFRRIKI